MKLQKAEGRANSAGIRIRQRREALGLSQEQLAARAQLEGLNITQKAVSRIETGDRVVPDYELPVLARILTVTVDWLLGLTD